MNILNKIKILFNQNSLKKVLNFLILSSLLWTIYVLITEYLINKKASIYRIESGIFLLIFISLIKICTEKYNRPIIKDFKFTSTEKFILFAGAIFIWILIYYSHLSIPLLSDDYIFICRFRSIKNVFFRNEMFRPFFNIIFYINHSVYIFHIISFFLHLACALIIFIICEKLFTKFHISFFIFTIFLYSPIQPESVVWISGLQEILWFFFVLSALFFYIRNQTPKKIDIALSSLFIILALFSKETAICFIPIFLLVEFFLYHFERIKKLAPIFSIYGIISIIFLFLRLSQGGIQQKITFPSFYFIKQFFLQPYRIFFFPLNEKVIPIIPFTFFIVSILFIIWVTYLILRNQFPIPVFIGMGIILLSTMPVYKMFFVGKDLQGSRYLYAATWGWGIILAFILISRLKKKWLALVFQAICVTILILLLRTNIKPWEIAGKTINELKAKLNHGEILDNVPDNYLGAYILREGYREFLYINYTDTAKRTK